MRSELVFSASSKVPNRFLLCKVVCAAVGKLHRSGAAVQHTINKSLSVADGETPESRADAS